MAEVVLIHGIGQERRSARELQARWRSALADGLAAAGFDADVLTGVTAAMAFYGDLFATPGAQGAPLDGALTDEQQEFADASARSRYT